MGFEELAGELSKGADSEGRKIIHAAEKNAGKVVEDAKGKAEEIVKAAKKEAADLAKQEASERATSAKLAAKKTLDEARDEAVEASMGQLWQRFKADSMKKSVYPGLIERLVSEGMAELGTGSAIVYARGEDAQYAKSGESRKLPQEYCGGVIVESKDGKVRVNKTLEEIFAQKKPALRKEIYDRLF
ncbi:MAG: V-type ATP synthase subunit E family protein [Candidatus Micrarchaeia archaeon]|jgi:vacuolar-type H+-ATPase subunit E/Vma4